MSSSRGGQSSRTGGRGASKGKSLQFHESPPNLPSHHDSSQWAEDDIDEGIDIDVNIEASPWLDCDQIFGEMEANQGGGRGRGRGSGSGHSSGVAGGRMDQAGDAGGSEASNMPDYVKERLDKDKESSSAIYSLHYERVYNSDWIQTNAKCNYCGRLFNMGKKGGYGSLHHHIMQKHPDKVPNAPSQRQIRFAPTGEGGSSQPALWQFSQNRWRDDAAEMICGAHLAFSFAEKVCVTEAIQDGLQPAAKPISRRTISRTIVQKFKAGKDALY